MLPPYHHTNFTSIMVLATYGIGYNILIGYTGLLSLGHAMFFAAGLYAAGLTVHYFGIDPVSAFVFGAAGRRWCSRRRSDWSRCAPPASRS